MHERSLAQALLRQIETHAAAQQAAHVTNVTVQLGPLSGVEPVLLARAFAELSQDTIVEHATVHWIETPLVAQCLECGHEFEVPRFRFHCLACGSGRTRIVRGDAVILESIVIADELAPTDRPLQTERS